MGINNESNLGIEPTFDVAMDSIAYIERAAELSAKIPWTLIFIGIIIYITIYITFRIAIQHNYGLSRIWKSSDDNLMVSFKGTNKIVILLIVILNIFVFPKLLGLEYVYEMSNKIATQIKNSQYFIPFIILQVLTIISYIVFDLNRNYKKINYSNENIKNDSMNKNNEDLPSTDDLKKIFTYNNAMEKDKAISKSYIKDICTKPIYRTMLEQLRMKTIIRKSRGKYYFSEKAEFNIGYRFLSVYLNVLKYSAVIGLIYYLLWKYS